VLRQVRPDPIWKLLKTVWGIGSILTTMIRLDAGELGRFVEVGDFVSYCRCVRFERTSNGKKKGEGTPRTAIGIWPGPSSKPRTSRSVITKSLAANQRKASKTNTILAPKALAHKLARASFFVMRG
jgi:Transposase IS116/IS110/IS902 family